jgi:hypothetical protein
MAWEVSAELVGLVCCAVKVPQAPAPSYAPVRPTMVSGSMP